MRDSCCMLPPLKLIWRCNTKIVLVMTHLRTHKLVLPLFVPWFRSGCSFFFCKYFWLFCPSCSLGYYLNYLAIFFSEVDGCLSNNGGCHTKRKCTTTTAGGHSCGDCPSGWINDGDTGCKGLGDDGCREKVKSSLWLIWLFYSRRQIAHAMLCYVVVSCGDVFFIGAQMSSDTMTPKAIDVGHWGTRPCWLSPGITVCL